MPEIHSQTTIDMPVIEAWSRLRDLRAAANYVPGVTRIEISTPAAEGVGASRRVHMKKRAPVDETVTEWNDGSDFTLRLHEGDRPAAPFKWASFKYEIAEAAAGATAVRLTLSYQMGMGPFGRLLDAVLIRRLLRRSNKTVAANMKRFYETGERTNGDAV